MKKRIGTKIYDTDSSELISDTDHGKLYRKRTRAHECFIVNGDDIIPVTEDEAKELLSESGYMAKIPESNSIMVRIDRDVHAVIAKMAKEDDITIGAEIRKLAGM